MKLGVHLVNFTLPGGPESIGPTLAATGVAVQEAGLVEPIRISTSANRARVDCGNMTHLENERSHRSSDPFRPTSDQFPPLLTRGTSPEGLGRAHRHGARGCSTHSGRGCP